MPANGTVKRGRKRKRYDDEFRASTVLMLHAAGYFETPRRKGALAQVSAAVGVPHPTVSRWGRAVSNPPPNELVHNKKIGLIELFDNEIRAILTEMDITRQDATYQQMGVVLGIIFDKTQLLTGGPTENVNQRHVLKWIDVDPSR